MKHKFLVTPVAHSHEIWCKFVEPFSTFSITGEDFEQHLVELGQFKIN
jgi:hypothetical protein